MGVNAIVLTKWKRGFVAMRNYRAGVDASTLWLLISSRLGDWVTPFQFSCNLFKYMAEAAQAIIAVYCVVKKLISTFRTDMKIDKISHREHI